MIRPFHHFRISASPETMIVSSLIGKINKTLATPMLRSGLSLRVRLGGGVIRPSATLDYLSFVPWAQHLVSSEVRYEAKQIQAEKDKEPSAFDKFIDVTWDRLFENASRSMAPPPSTPTGRSSSVTTTKKSHNHDNPNLEALEAYLRPALVPNERWEDIIQRWYFNTQFVKWARLEFLDAKYGDTVRQVKAMPKYETLNALLPSRRNNNDSESLKPPSAATVIKAFRMKNWTREKNLDAVSDRMNSIARQMGGQIVPIPGSAILFPDIASDTDTPSLSLEDILEVAGGHVASCGPFNVFCEKEAGLFELWTSEYIDSLASYLLERADRIDGSTIIVDVGAGDGMLAQFLRNAISEFTAKKKKNNNNNNKNLRNQNIPQIVATDDGSWKIRPRFDVEPLECREAISNYRKDCDQLIVLCSWMPHGDDWTSEMRAGGVDEYILIGECDDGNCGDNWLTWGNSEFRDDVEDTIEAKVPYETDGFKRYDLRELSRLQFSRFDSSVSSNSTTVSFRPE